MTLAIKNKITSMKSISTSVIALSIVVCVFAAVDKGPYLIINTVVMGGMLALVAMGLALVFGVMNIAQFAHGEFFMIGSLTAYYIVKPLQKYVSIHPSPVLEIINPVIGICGATLVGFAIGVICEKIVFLPLRKRSTGNWVMNSFLITLGLSIILVNTHQLIFTADFKGIIGYWQGPSISIMDVYISQDRFISSFLSFTVVILFGIFMKYSRTGLAIRSVSQDETGALMVGINLNGIQTLTMGLSCSFAALAGASLLYLYPSYPTVGMEPLYMAWFVVILAGLGNIIGAVICALIVSLIKVLTVEYVGTGWDFVIPSIIIIILLILKPSGIFGSTVRGAHDK
jgi:branched-chain amino acid transport system permease protein